jgi:hypothetical protein
LVAAISAVLWPNGVVAEGTDGAALRRVDFYYLKLKRERIMVPFSAGERCKSIYLSPVLGVIIDRVVADGREVPAESVRGTADGWWNATLENPGPSFRYEQELENLGWEEPKREFTGQQFPVPRKPLPDVIEVYYRPRCATGEIGEVHMTRGIYLELGAQKTRKEK